ncbi:MAG: hypothetical protein U0V75_18690 [Ferruginibacter sp.]
MQVNKPFLMVIALLLLLYSCNRNYVPRRDNIPVVTLSSNTKTVKSAPAAATAPATGTRTMVKRAVPVKTSVPQVIWVNDKVAKKNFDGRLYYDLEGRRYWKNYADGKYYLFNRAMYNNSAFKPR